MIKKRKKKCQQLSNFATRGRNNHVLFIRIARSHKKQASTILNVRDAAKDATRVCPAHVYIEKHGKSSAGECKKNIYIKKLKKEACLTVLYTVVLLELLAHPQPGGTSAVELDAL